jgi:glutathione peroxidase
LVLEGTAAQQAEVVIDPRAHRLRIPSGDKHLGNPHMIRATLALALAGAVSAVHAACPAFLDHDMRVLRKPDTVNLCQRYAGQPMLIVNTASSCGYTPQFQGLETLHQTYRERGLRVAGFPSNDFHQEARSEEETAKVCYVNYGVTFDMYAESHVRGADANPLFAELARQSQAPGWNFNKYLVDADGKVVAVFGASTRPDSPELREAIEKLL